MPITGITRRVLLQRAAAAGGCAALAQIAPAFAWADTTSAALPFTARTQVSDSNVIDLVIADLALPIDGRTGNAMAVNGTVASEMDLDFSELQEIDAPLVETASARNEPTLTYLEFDDLELALDFTPALP